MGGPLPVAMQIVGVSFGERKTPVCVDGTLYNSDRKARVVESADVRTHTTAELLLKQARERRREENKNPSKGHTHY